MNEEKKIACFECYQGSYDEVEECYEFSNGHIGPKVTQLVCSHCGHSCYPYESLEILEEYAELFPYKVYNDTLDFEMPYPHLESTIMPTFMYATEMLSKTTAIIVKETPKGIKKIGQSSFVSCKPSYDERWYDDTFMDTDLSTCIG